MNQNTLQRIETVLLRVVLALCVLAVFLFVYGGSVTVRMDLMKSFWQYNIHSQVFFIPFMFCALIVDGFVLPRESVKSARLWALTIALSAGFTVAYHFIQFPPFPWGSAGTYPGDEPRPPDAYGYAITFVPAVWAAYRACYPSLETGIRYFLRGVLGLGLLGGNAFFLEYIIARFLYGGRLDSGLFWASDTFLPFGIGVAVCSGVLIAGSSAITWFFWRKLITRTSLIFNLVILVSAFEICWLVIGSLTGFFSDLEISH